MQKFDQISPYGAAILIYLIFPLLSLQVKSTINSVIADGRSHVSTIVDSDLPYYLTPSSINDYVDYAIDAAQVFPVMVLPIVGAVYGLSTGIPAAVTLSFLFVACVLAVAMTAWIVTRSPSDYVSRKWCGYSIITLAGVAVNVIGMILALVFG
jgi:hypothetical protein